MSTTRMTPEEVDHLNQEIKDRLSAGEYVLAHVPPSPTRLQRLKSALFSLLLAFDRPFFMMMFYFIIGASAALTETYRTGGIALLFCSSILLAHFYHGDERKERQRRIFSVLAELAMLLSQKFQPQGWVARHPEQPPTPHTLESESTDDPAKIALMSTKRRLALHILSKLSDDLMDLCEHNENPASQNTNRRASIDLMERTFWNVANLLGYLPALDDSLDVVAQSTSDKAKYADSVIDFLQGLLSQGGSRIQTTRQKVNALFLALQIIRKLGYLPSLEQTNEWKAWKDRERKKAKETEEAQSNGCGCEGSTA